VSENSLRSWAKLVRPQDLVWLVVFALPLARMEYGDIYEYGPLIALGVAQILEPRVPASASTKSRVFWIVLKLVLSFLLIGYNGSINSRYWPALLLPVVSAATTFGFVGSMVFTLLTCAAYLVFLSFVTKEKAYYCRPGTAVGLSDCHRQSGQYFGSGITSAIRKTSSDCRATRGGEPAHSRGRASCAPV
jgi:hypothetical protein